MILAIVEPHLSPLWKQQGVRSMRSSKQHTGPVARGNLFFCFVELYEKVRKMRQYYLIDSEDIEEGFVWGSQQEMSIPGSQVWDAASIDMKLQINVLFWTTAESPSSQQCTIPAYSVVISYRLLTQHIVHARESLAMSCVNATVTQHISAGDSFFLFAPCFHSCPSSPLFRWLFLF